MSKAQKGHPGRNGKALAFFVVVGVFVPCCKLFAQDTASYLNKAWRDSVANYRGRVEAYHQELYSYDWGMTFSMLPVAGEAYVDQMGTGILYSAARAASLALGAVGAVRFAEGKPSFGINLGMIAVGIFGYVALKLSELSDVRHTASHLNEHLVEEFRIATPDIVSHSIRYPTRAWPDSVTSWPPVPPRVNPREAIEKPLPTVLSRQLRDSLQPVTR